MSHLTQAEFNAARIRCEETINNILARIESCNIRQELKEKLISGFRLDEILGEMSGINLSMSYAALNRFEAVAQKANSYLFAIDTYVAYNFNLDVTDYQTAVREAMELLTVSSDDVTDAALASTEDELLKTYIRAAANQNRYQSANALIAAATDKMKESRTYKKRAAENARKILADKYADENNAAANITDDMQIADVICKANLERHNNAVDKAVRNRVLTSVIKIIREQGFIVKKENVEECGGHAKISAIKPNGERADFAVYMDGKFVYKFHDYEGLACEKDIGKFEEKFESIYGIKLEDKKIHWSNPDRIDKTAFQSINTNKIGG